MQMEKNDPQHFVNRYLNEPTYKAWFDKNWGSKYKSIYEAVGLPEPTTSVIKTGSSTKSDYTQLYKDKDYGFALDLLNKWNVDESQEQLAVLYYSGKISGVVVPAIGIMYTQSSPELSSSMNCDDMVSQVPSFGSSNQKIIKCMTEPINGGVKTTIKILAKHSIEGKYFKQKSIIVTIYKDTGDVYALLFNCDVKDYNQVVQDFDNLQKSFVTFTPSD